MKRPFKPGRTGPSTGTPPCFPARLAARILATGLGTGYAPLAQGTLASALLLLLWYRLVPAKWYAEYPLALVINLGSVPLSGWGERLWGPDAGRITIDEWAGQTVALLGVPRNPAAMITAFLLFRLFDTFKLPFIRRHIETLPGGWGVTLDDTVAGLLARLCYSVYGKLLRK